MKYKEGYERYKLVCTVITIVVASMCLVWPHARFLEACMHVILALYYSSVTLREHILIANGSK